MGVILVSACLLGENVRYDGGNCLVENSIFEHLIKNYQVKSICPEVMAGMSTPRQPIEIRDGEIYTEAGDNLSSLFIPVKVALNDMVNLDQIKYAILKDDSPSCGTTSIYDGSFSGTKISGEGIIAYFLRELGVKVYSENNFIDLIKDMVGDELLHD